MLFSINPQSTYYHQLGFNQGLREGLNPESRLLKSFPKLASTSYTIIGSATPRYNCIAWAVGKTDAWWWPGPLGPAYWPPDIPQDTSIQTFVMLFKSLGYTLCSSADFEWRFEKIAIFANHQDVTHAAKQLGNGRWSSKLGISECVEHDLHAIAGHVAGEYGDVAQIMRRRRSIRKIVLESIHYAIAQRLNRAET